ncbi:Peptidase family C78 domain containing protein [Elaphomyces granulatus]
MDHENALLSCPLCEFSDYDSYFLSQHVDLCHPEDEDPPSITDGDGGDSIDHTNREDGQNTQCHSSNTEQEKQYTDCPEGCGEIVTTAELSLHMDLHMAENFALEDILPSSESKTVNSAGFTDEQETHSDIQASKSLHDYEIPKIKHSHRRRGRRSKEPGTKESSTKGGSIRKLGRAELGPHAHEKQMPAWLRKMLEGGAKVTLLNRISPNGLIAKDVIVENETPQIIPILIQLCGQDPTVRRAFFCSPAIRHVFKMPREGGFCGYRNIQMLISHIQDSQRPGHEHFPGSLPSILKLQDMIEQAWDMGFNAVARLETGGIRGTRKYIGTPEASRGPSFYHYLTKYLIGASPLP